MQWHVTIIIDGCWKVDYGDGLESGAEIPIRSTFVASERNGLRVQVKRSTRTTSTRNLVIPMRLSWNEIRTRAAEFAREWRDAAYEKGETQSFYNDFFGIFDVKRRSVARYEQHVRKLGNQSGFIDLFCRTFCLLNKRVPAVT